MRKHTLTLGIVLLLTITAGAATYNGVVAIDTATDEGAGTTTIGSSGTDNVTTISETGSFYNIATFYIGYAWSGEVSGKLLTQGDIGSDSDRASITIARGSSQVSGELEIDGGNLYASSLYTCRNDALSAAITISSGTLDCSGIVRFGYTAGATTTYTQTGGTVDLHPSGDAITLGNSANTATTLIISGGSLNFGAQDTYLGYGDGSTCRLEIHGSAATITASGNTRNDWYNDPDKTTLAFILDDSEDHITTIEAQDVNGGATIDMGLNGYTPEQSQVFDLFLDTSGGFPDVSEFTLSAEDIGTWELQLNGAGDTLQAKYLVPEPATMGLLAVGGLALLKRKRR